MGVKSITEILQLIECYLQNNIDTKLFCKKYEQIYSFEIDEDDIETKYRKSLHDIFEIVVRYSPFEDEVNKYDCYYGENDVRGIVKRVAKELEL